MTTAWASPGYADRRLGAWLAELDAAAEDVRRELGVEGTWCHPALSLYPVYAGLIFGDGGE